MVESIIVKFYLVIDSPEIMWILVIWKSLVHAYLGFLLEYNVRKIYYSNIQYILLLVKISQIM